MNPSQIQSYYEESFQFLQARKKRWVAQLVLLNNLQRGDLNIASTLLLTLFNRTMSALYDDKMQVKFLPSQGINQQQLNSYNSLAQSDYLEMEKPKLDYDWDWDTLFFGRGYLETLNFSKKRKIMTPSVINPLAFGYDPFFSSKEEWRYYWKWITKSKWDLQKLINKGLLKITNVNEISGGIDPYLWEYKTLRDAAKKAVQPPIESINNDVFQILEFFGYNEAGNRCVRWVDRDFAKIIYEEELDLKDAEDGSSKWPIVIKESFREPHSTINFSVADLIEDKHRAKSVLLNLAYIAAKDKANPLYWYDPEKVKDVAQFFSRQINQHIPVEGNGAEAIGPINTQDPMDPGLIQFMTMLQQEANDPVGTGVSLEPDTGAPETATAKAIDQQLNDMAQSLQSKIMQFGESEFWSHWFHRYARHADILGEKMANIVGVKGISTEVIDLKDFNTEFPPGVLVYSAKEAEYKELVLRRDLMQLYPQLATTLDPDGMRNFNKHVFFPKFLQDPSLIDIMLPKTLDEMRAEEENELMLEDSSLMPDVLPTDNHTTHIYTHYMLQPKSWAAWFHIQWHQELLAEQKAQEQMAMEQEMAGQMAVGAEKQSPINATAPLKTEMKNKPVTKKV